MPGVTIVTNKLQLQKLNKIPVVGFSFLLASSL